MSMDASKASKRSSELGFVLSLAAFLVNGILCWYRESRLHRMILAFARFSKRLFFGSRILEFIRRKESATRVLTESRAGRMLTGSFRGLAGCACRMGKPLQFSLAGRLAHAAVKEFSVVLGLYVLLQTAIPHQFWYNGVSLGLALVVLSLYLFKCGMEKDQELDPLRLDTALLLFMLTGALCAVTSLVLRDSVRIYVLNLIPIAIVLVMVNALRSSRDFRIFTGFLLTGTVIASLYGFFQYAMGIEVDETLVDTLVSGSIRRLFSTMGNPNNYAEYLLLCLPFFAASFLNAKTVRTKLLVGFLALLPLGNLYLTSSRSSWLGLVVAACVFLFITERRLLPVLLLAGAGLVPLLPASILQRLGTIGRDSSSTYRLKIWDGSLRLLRDYWLTGIGQGPAPFMALFPNYSTLRGVVHSHMLPLQIWIETGISGFLAFVWMMGRLVKKTLAHAFSGADRERTVLMAAALSGLAGLIFTGSFEYVWFYPRVMGMFWIVTGFLMALLGGDRKHAAN
ncbi:MAG TPA: hypothetical protein DD727_01135 [Clostridiales bacterium]|nr:hypothetical protein [Clostridiales bacterium]